eukprot:TRINITY_DN93254_c0_g1_i1.p1 TRINITY_DN93254_c0_g1~~TRINITY_DN93254_c0_g1_i1.p1  ORF type:complete len:232 (+),score=45.71 TRINITY_DN93254_c0_g1_i1:74-769(+)
MEASTAAQATSRRRGKSFVAAGVCALLGAASSAFVAARSGCKAVSRLSARPSGLQTVQQAASAAIASSEAGNNTQSASVAAAGGAAALAATVAVSLAASRRTPQGRRTVSVARGAEMQPGMPDAGIALITREDRKTEMKAQFDKEKWWRVLLHNDDIHTFEYVTGCLTRTVKHLSRRKAYNITWEAHSSGMATVACVWKNLAEQFCVNLQQLGLTVSIAPDSQFEGNKGGE